jgi:hypothetical protein
VSHWYVCRAKWVNSPCENRLYYCHQVLWPQTSFSATYPPRGLLKLGRRATGSSSWRAQYPSLRVHWYARASCSTYISTTPCSHQSDMHRSFRYSCSGLPLLNLDLGFSAFLQSGPLLDVIAKMLRGASNARGPLGPANGSGLSQLSPENIHTIKKVLRGAKVSIHEPQAENSSMLPIGRAPVCIPYYLSPQHLLPTSHSSYRAETELRISRSALPTITRSITPPSSPSQGCRAFK